MKKLKLSIIDRVNIQTLLPTKGAYIQMLLVRNLNAKLEFTPEEIRDCGIRDGENGMIGWQKGTIIDIELTEEQIELLKPGVELVKESDGITMQLIDLIDKLGLL